MKVLLKKHASIIKVVNNSGSYSSYLVVAETFTRQMEIAKSLGDNPVDSGSPWDGVVIDSEKNE